MAKTSAGLLMYRIRDGQPQVFLAHLGGPFYQNKDNGFWTIPKGEQDDGEDLFITAKREFEEETGIKLDPEKKYIDLGTAKYNSGKVIYAWAFEDGDFDPAKMVSNTFKLEWPPKSGKIQEFPENDRGDYFSMEEALVKIYVSQKPFLDRLQSALGSGN